MKFFINILVLKFILHFLSVLEMSPAKSNIELPTAKQVFLRGESERGNSKIFKA